MSSGLVIIYLCTSFNLVNTSNFMWNEHDGKSLTSAAKTCYKRYRTCLKKFEKYNERDFYAVCGSDNDK